MDGTMESPGIDGFLADEPITGYQRGVSALTSHQIVELCRSIPEWGLIEREDIRRLERVFHVPDFRAALAFAQQVGELAEIGGHHPAILIEWGRVTVTWWTLRMRGLHRNDFVMAARTDRLWDAWIWDNEDGASR
jgi:4a-hydroxytetrahydrobiopterin dehydratase